MTIAPDRAAGKVFYKLAAAATAARASGGRTVRDGAGGARSQAGQPGPRRRRSTAWEISEKKNSPRPRLRRGRAGGARHATGQAVPAARRANRGLAGDGRQPGKSLKNSPRPRLRRGRAGGAREPGWPTYFSRAPRRIPGTKGGAGRPAHDVSRPTSSPARAGAWRDIWRRNAAALTAAGATESESERRITAMRQNRRVQRQLSRTRR